MPYDLVVSKKVVPLTIYFIKTLPYRKMFFVKNNNKPRPFLRRSRFNFV